MRAQSSILVSAVTLLITAAVPVLAKGPDGAEGAIAQASCNTALPPSDFVVSISGIEPVPSVLRDPSLSPDDFEIDPDPGGGSGGTSCYEFFSICTTDPNCHPMTSSVVGPDLIQPGGTGGTRGSKCGWRFCGTFVCECGNYVVRHICNGE